MSNNNTMTNMYRTILLALPALLLLAACADDVTPPAEPADTLAGQPVRFTATGLTVTPAGVAQTKADGTETDFPAEGSTITVYMTDTDGNTWQADYTYDETDGWTSTAPLLWPDTQNEYTFTAISPADTDPEITLPAEWTETDLTKYEAIRATYEAKRVLPSMSPISLTLRHALVKVQVEVASQQVHLLEAPVSGSISLTNAITTVNTGMMQLLTSGNNIHKGYVLPTTQSPFFQILTDDNIYEVSNNVKDDFGNDKNISAGTSVTIELKTQP